MAGTTDPEVVAHEAVDERINEAVGISKPETDEVWDGVAVLLLLRIERPELRHKEVEEEEPLEGKPADREHDHYRQQHLYYLRTS